MCIRTSLSIVRHWRDIYNFIRATQIVQKSWTLLLPHKPSKILFSSRDFSREQTPLSCSPWSIFSGWLFWFGWFNLTVILEGGYKREYCVSIHRDTSKSSSTGRSTAQSREHKSLPSSNMAECDQCAITCNWTGFIIAWPGHNWPRVTEALLSTLSPMPDPFSCHSSTSWRKWEVSKSTGQTTLTSQ